MYNGAIGLLKHNRVTTVQQTAHFPCANRQTERRVRKLLRRLPPVAGAPVVIESAPLLRDRRGPVHGAAFLRERRIALSCTSSEFPRIFVHELFHFIWLRAGNRARRSFEEVLAAEQWRGARGELGWSAEWRKRALSATAVRARDRAWREYCCESFCDTASWLYSGMPEHDEFTLAARFRRHRRAWFATFVARGLSI